MEVRRDIATQCFWALQHHKAVRLERYSTARTTMFSPPYFRRDIVPIDMMPGEQASHKNGINREWPEKSNAEHRRQERVSVSSHARDRDGSLHVHLNLLDKQFPM